MSILYVAEEAKNHINCGRLLRVTITSGICEEVAILFSIPRAMRLHPTDPIIYLITDRGLERMDLNKKNFELIHHSNDLQDIVIDPNGESAFVTEFIRGRILRVNLRKNNVEELVSGLNFPRGVALNLKGDIIFVTECPSGVSGHLRYINIKQGTNRMLNKHLGNPISLATSSDGETLYITEHSIGSITAISVQDGKIHKVVGGLSGPRSIVASKKSLYVLEAFGAQKKFDSLSSNRLSKKGLRSRIVEVSYSGELFSLILQNHLKPKVITSLF